MLPLLVSTLTFGFAAWGGKYDPYDQDEITEALKRVVFDEDLRLELVKAGRVHAMKFREEETIPQLMEVYKELL